jgi:hypothetical protein
MSHKRSGLLAGLVIGLLAALTCATALGAAVMYQNGLPTAVKTFGNGYPLSLGPSLVIALIIALAMGRARPSSIILPVAGGLYAGGAVVAGQITGLSIMWGVNGKGRGLPIDVADITLDHFSAGLPFALSLYRARLTETWPAWLSIALAAVAALLLLTLRVTRVRRAERAARAASGEQEQQEPEYRAPFEPAQSPAGQPATNLFTPRKPARD